MTRQFEIGGVCFAIQCPDQVCLPPNFLLFETKGKKPQYTYTLTLADALPPVQGQLIARRPDLLVLDTPQGEARLIGIKGAPGPYALYQETGPDAAQITYLNQWLALLDQDTVFNSLLALEKRMLAQNALVFHCAYILHEGQAILFSGPSGMGKSTQAGLWEQYRGVETINGDRALLRPIDGRWYACGWPVCGSSGICQDRQYPIRAVVMLSQAKENAARRLSPSEAFLQLYPQVTTNRWDTARSAQVLDLVTQLAESQPVFHLACDISRQAVEVLAQALDEPSQPEA